MLVTTSGIGRSGLSIVEHAFEFSPGIKPFGLLPSPRAVVVSGGIRLDSATMRLTITVGNSGGQSGSYSLDLILKTGGIEQRRVNSGSKTLAPGAAAATSMQLMVFDTDTKGGVEGVINLLGPTGTILDTKLSGSLGTVDTDPATLAFEGVPTWSLGF